MPFLYGSYALGRQVYSEYLSYRYPGYYIKPVSPLMQRVK
jgi:hypothetical protein